jgi:hypothetical protein
MLYDDEDDVRFFKYTYKCVIFFWLNKKNIFKQKKK